MTKHNVNFNLAVDENPRNSALRTAAPGVLAWLGQWLGESAFDFTHFRAGLSLSLHYDRDRVERVDNGYDYHLWGALWDDLLRLRAVGAQWTSPGYELSSNPPRWSPRVKLATLPPRYAGQDVDALITVELGALVEVRDLYSAAVDESDKVAVELWMMLRESIDADRYNDLVAKLEDPDPIPA